MDLGFTKRMTLTINVTPTIADEWLQRNDPQNRTISQCKVDEYARDMAGGRWGETHQGIAFDSNGLLFDGQHRLMAVVKSGATVPIRVDCGLPPETRRYIDQGKNRQLPNMLEWMGLFGDTPHHGVNSIAGTIRKMMTGYTSTKGAHHAPPKKWSSPHATPKRCVRL